MILISALVAAAGVHQSRLIPKSARSSKLNADLIDGIHGGWDLAAGACLDRRI